MATVRQCTLLAEYETPEAVVEATRRARVAGYRRMDAYTPFPVEGLAEELGFRRTNMSLVVLIGGIVGGLAGYLLQYWTSVIDYPLNIGGRPYHSWPAFIPVTFETTVLVASLSGVLGMLALNGLPRPHHPLFAIPEFARVNRDRFFLCIQAADPQFHEHSTREFLEQTGAMKVYDVPEM